MLVFHFIYCELVVTNTWNKQNKMFNPLNADLNPICHLLVLLGAHPILYISRIRVNKSHYICTFY
jgi:hypothetical protein